MPVSGLSRPLDIMLSAMMEEGTLVSWQIFGEQNGQTVFKLRFSDKCTSIKDNRDTIQPPVCYKKKSKSAVDHDRVRALKWKQKQKQSLHHMELRSENKSKSIKNHQDNAKEKLRCDSLCDSEPDLRLEVSLVKSCDSYGWNEQNLEITDEQQHLDVSDNEQQHLERLDDSVDVPDELALEITQNISDNAQVPGNDAEHSPVWDNDHSYPIDGLLHTSTGNNDDSCSGFESDSLYNAVLQMETRFQTQMQTMCSMVDKLRSLTDDKG